MTTTDMTNERDWKVHRLGEGDIALLRGLNALFAEAFEEAETYLGDPPSDAYLAARLRDPTFVALVATRDDVVIGGLTAYVLRKAERARAELYIYDLAVAEAERRHGIATALIQAVKPIAREVGAWVIFVQADHGDPPAIALYEKLGIREEVLHFDIAPE